MTPAMIAHEFGAEDVPNAARSAGIAKRNDRIKGVFDRVTRRFMLSPARLETVPAEELVRMILEVDETIRKSGIDEAGAVAAVKTYLQILKA